MPWPLKPITKIEHIHKTYLNKDHNIRAVEHSNVKYILDATLKQKHLISVVLEMRKLARASFITKCLNCQLIS
jgi:hypothetical protein